jgi:hypothetical protein
MVLTFGEKRKAVVENGIWFTLLCCITSCS